MKMTSMVVAAFLAFASSGALLAGCKADPHDTHIANPFVAPR